MKKKFKQFLKEQTKDFGLTDKAIDDLTKQGCEGLADDASDEDIQVKVLSLVPFARMMQQEITRKGMAKPSADEPSKKEGEGEGNNKPGNNAVPDWFKPFQDKMSALEKENADLKAKEAKAIRNAEIAEAAKKHGIPDYLLKRLAIADDADVEKELAAFRQDLVNHNLMPKEQGHETSTSLEALKTDAKAWAANL